MFTVSHRGPTLRTSSAVAATACLATLLVSASIVGAARTARHNGKTMPDRPPDRSWEARLEDGATMALGWATGTNVGCWPATENHNFTGHHVITSDTYGPDMSLFVRVTPEAGLDLSLYTLRIAPDDKHRPPEIYKASCQASYDRKEDNNPGVSEGVQVRGTHTYRVIVGIAGAGSVKSGGYRVDIWDESPK